MEYCFLLTGLAKSGKSTIERIVFRDPEGGVGDDKRFLTKDRTLRVKVVDLPETSVILEPASPSPFDASLFEGCCAVLYVVDITDDYVLSLTKLCALALRAHRSSPAVPIEVFLHKADAYEEHERQDVLRDISQKFKEEMTDICDSPVTISFHLTSVFDHTIYDCLSRVVQKHLDEYAALESLLDMLCSNSKIDKAFLFDTSRKLYVAADSSPFGIRSFELASVVLDMICDLDNIYRHRGSSLKYLGNKRRVTAPLETAVPVADSSSAQGEVRLANGIAVGYAQVNELLCMLYLINMDHHPGAPDKVRHNVLIAKETILKLLDKDHAIGQ